MSLIKSIIKEIAEFFIRKIRVLITAKSKGVENEVIELKKNGIIVIPNYLTKEKCDRYRELIDNYVDNENSNVWMDDEKADHRLYFINEINDEFKEYYDSSYFKKVLSSYLGTSNPSGMLLAGKISNKENNKGSGGGWHRDSPVSHQFKAVCYLNDVDDNNGPFQYIPGSHKNSNVLFAYFKKVFKAGQYRFTEFDVENYTSKFDKRVSTISGGAGSLVLVDTKGIHRGKPLNEGTRYVLFCYYWHNAIPGHFQSLRQDVLDK
jgi:hypothetical protein